jgi:PTH1 family peptidyl-tRNA hydrolase
MPLIAGLGNPGRKYSGSRHNIGFELIDELAESLSVRLSAGRGPFYTGKARLPDHQLRLVKPSTYMNHSGDAVQQALQWFKVPPSECLVCYDDLNLDVGVIRMRRGGTAGGHNGMKDIIQKLGTDQFPRLRIGIGNDFRGGQQINYVLPPFSAEQREHIDISIKRAADAVLTFTREGIDAAMNEYN